MDRYVSLRTAPRSGHWSDDVPMIRDLTVFETQDEPARTGLLDARGVPIYRVRERIKMGFT